jgi:hypothetical protein
MTSTALVTLVLKPAAAGATSWSDGRERTGRPMAQQHINRPSGY